MKRRRAEALRRSAALATATGAFLYMGALPALAASGNSGDPPGANGTIKIHQAADDTFEHNVPHTACSFYVAFFGFDSAQSGTLSFDLQAPTQRSGSDQSLGSYSITLANASRGHGNTFDPVGSGAPTDSAGQAGPFTLDFTGVTPQAQQGYHVKASFAITHVDGKSGKSTTTEKHKVFWVAPCTTPPGPPSTGALSIAKVGIGGLTGDFLFDVTGGPTAVSNPITVTANGPAQTVSDLAPGNYTITEEASSGSSLTGIDVDPSGSLVGSTDLTTRSVTVAVQPGTTPSVEATFTNTPTAVLGNQFAVAPLQICKNTTGSLAGTFPFTVTGPAGFTAQTVNVTVPAGSHHACSSVLASLPTGQYTVTESANPAIYTLKSIAIAGGTGHVSGSSAVVTLAAVQSPTTPTTVVATFTNAPVTASGVTGGPTTPPTAVLGERITRNTPTTAPRVLGVQFSRPNTLPFTGSHTKPLLVAGVLALVCGSLLVLAGRRPATAYSGRHRLA